MAGGGLAGSEQGGNDLAALQCEEIAMGPADFLDQSMGAEQGQKPGNFACLLFPEGGGGGRIKVVAQVAIAKAINRPFKESRGRCNKFIRRKQSKESNNALLQWKKILNKKSTRFRLFLLYSDKCSKV